MLEGANIINGQAALGELNSMKATNPATGESLGPEYWFASSTQIDEAVEAASEAFRPYRALGDGARAEFLASIAENLESLRNEIVARGVAETALTEERLNSELTRTTNQIRMFADLLNSGAHRGVRIDPPLPDRQPLPRPDLRQWKIPLGPVVVFGASNFPLAFSVAGGDTASALAAGCPVVVKAHNAHPGLSEIVGKTIIDTVRQHNLHPGVFSLLYGEGTDIGQQLVAHPDIKAVGFTGSRQGGMALSRTASERSEPIPVYAEMSAINPVILLEDALLNRGEEIAQGFVKSLTGSAGQLCTAPGLVFVPKNDSLRTFTDTIRNTIEVQAGQTMLSSDICARFITNSHEVMSIDGVTKLAAGSEGKTSNSPGSLVLKTDIETFIGHPTVHQELFGPAAVLVEYGNFQELVAALEEIEGQLTASIWAGDADFEKVDLLLPILEESVGRIVYNGWPTGVEVGHAVVHGGPFPATSNPSTTSVGSLAIERFQRPIAYQNFPEAHLAQELRLSNPKNVVERLIDGVRVVED